MAATKRKPAGGYDAHRDKMAEASRGRAARGREIGAVPDIADVGRRERCRGSLLAFCQTYNPAAFYLPWSADQLRSVARLEEAALHGALYAFAEPRGSGKTTRVRMAALWALAYRHRRYPFLIGANAAKAAEALDALKTYMRFLPAFAADFPEISWPAVRLGGIAGRAGGQTCGGESTMIEWGKERVVLPTVPPPANWPDGWPLRADGMVPTSGSVVGASGLTGDGIRGSLHTLTTGESIRPDLVLLDDPQTHESAHSPAQNQTREALVNGDVLGMAGPGQTLSAVMPCTVIAPGDFVDRTLDRSLHPLWRGERSSLLPAMPADLAAWDDYFDVYARCAQLEPPDFTAANAHYVAHRAALDAGAAAGWEARKLPGEVSAVQHAMHLFFRDKRAFWAEYQNQPLAAARASGAKELVPAAVADRLAGTARFEVPAESTRLTAFFDVSRFVVWHAVVAWDEGFGGVVVDYGCTPGQARPVFRQADARPSLPALHPGHSDPQLVYAGLQAATAAVLGRTYPRAGGGELSVARALVDSGWEKDAVIRFVRACPFRATLLPSAGYGRSATQVGVARWKRRVGERAGWHWRVTAGHDGRGQQVQYDPDAWKSFAHARLTTAPGGRGALLLYGSPERHRRPDHALIGLHCGAEYAEPATLRGDTFDKWQERPARDDNHLWDCLAGAAVAAGVDGLVFQPGGPPAPPVGPRPPRRSFAEAVRERRAAFS